MTKTTVYIPKTTVYKRFERKYPSGVGKFPMPTSLFSDGYSSRLEFVPEGVVCWITHADMAEVPGRMHHRYNLVLSLKNQFVVVGDGLRFILSPDQAMLVFPTQCHHYEHPPQVKNDQKYPFTKLHITFLLPEKANALQLEPLRNRVFSLDAKTSDRILKITEIVYKRTESDYSEIPFYLASVLDRFLALSDEPLTIPETGNKVFINAIRYIRNNYTSPISVKTVADAIGISASRLSAVFRQQTRGITIGNYIAKLRHYRAIELLSTSDMNIAEISRECGFNNQFDFSRHFKRHQDQHLSPASYREILRKRGIYGWKKHPADHKET